MALITEGETLANLANSEIERPVPSNCSKLSKTRALAEVILNELGTFPTYISLL